MAVIAYPGNLQTSQAGNADSTNVIQRNGAGEVNGRQMVLRITTNAGTTVTLKILGSVDGTTYFKVPYSVMSAIAGDYSTADIVTTTAKTELYALLPGQPWNYLKINQSVNTGMTPTSDLL
jgi:hypothetical protein